MKIPKLKLKLWQEIVFLLIVSIMPIIFIILEFIKPHGSLFIISTLAPIGLVFLIAHIIRKFVFVNYITKSRDRCVMLEHDFMIIEKNENLAHVWGKLNAIICGYDATTLLISFAVCFLFLGPHLSDLGQPVAFECAMIVTITFMLGLFWKIVLYVRRWLK